ncbi:MAG: hypothetical protein NTW52_07305 [Planctomycetota bacterium]|nr:hypothetical protein [Planctomycetota bacterium]
MMQRFYRRVDWWIERLKWPVAVAAVLWTPLLIWAWVLLGYRVMDQPFASLWFAAGVLLFFVSWKSILRYQSLWRWLVRAEHEATHLLFAALTGHPVLNWKPENDNNSNDPDHNDPDNNDPNRIIPKRSDPIYSDPQETTRKVARESHSKAASNRSSKMAVEFPSSSNWLIQIAPYFFPTAAGILWIAAIFIPLGFLGWTTIALGLATGFHVTSTIIEIRTDRDELQQLGWRFCWMFLPAANLMVLGCLLSFSQEGFTGIFDFLSDSIQPIQTIVAYFATRPE